MPPILLYLVLGASLVHHQVAAETDQDLNEEQWEYEPRIWSVDEAEQQRDNAEQQQESFGDVFEGELTDLVSPPVNNNEDQRKLNHYLDLANISLNKQQTSQEDECNQFRVDTREAVICDKKRCDKLDFEWPKYDNQLVIMETTRHGMRFHRADYAFEPKPQLNRAPANDIERVKIDLFEIFKPKPSVSSTTSATISPELVSPGDSSSTTATTTDTAPSTSTTTTTTTTTTATTQSTTSTTNSQDEGGSTSTTSAPNDRNEEILPQDDNSTQLVTTFRLNTKRTEQKIMGFGGALSDSTCRNIKSLSPAMARSLMEDYYGDRGLKYSFARMSIGSSDFSTSPYTNNDRIDRLRQALDERDDVDMNHFRLTEEDYQFKIPMARQAIAISKQPIKFYASLWSPPIWMKNNSHIVHGYLKGDVYGPYYKALAELMVKWLEAYKKNGIDFWGLTGLNEPVTGVKPFIFHNSLGITREDYVTFYKLYLGPTMWRRGFQNVKLMMLDDNKGYAPLWVRAMMEDKEAAKYISGVATHWYMNDEYENLNFMAKLYPDKFILPSEACNGFLPFQVHALPGNWDRGVAYMYDIIKLMQKNAVGWVDWNMALDLTGGPSWINNLLDAPIIVNAKRDEYYKSPMFYAIGHFSRFVRPGSTRLDYRIANARFDYPLEAVAFHDPDDHIVIVVLNANKHQTPFKIIVDKQVIKIVTLRAESFNTIIFRWKTGENKH